MVNHHMGMHTTHATEGPWRMATSQLQHAAVSTWVSAGAPAPIARHIDRKQHVAGGAVRTHCMHRKDRHGGSVLAPACLHLQSHSGEHWAHAACMALSRAVDEQRLVMALVFGPG